MPTSLPQLFGEIGVEKVHSITVLGLEGGSKEASKVESKLSAHPLVSSFPSSGPISNNSREIVGETQILSSQRESPSEIRVGHLKFVLVDINDHVGQLSLSLEESVGSADDIAADARLGEDVDIGEREIGMAQVASCVQPQWQAKFSQAEIANLGKVRQFRWRWWCVYLFLICDLLRQVFN